MKFSCTQENLTSGLGLVAHVAGRSASLPILSNILLRTTKGGLELVATNLEVAIVTTVRGKVEAEGALTVQGRLLTESVGLLPHERVDLVVEGTNLTLTCGKRRTVIHGLPVDDFPVIPELEGGQSSAIPTQELEQALSQVMFAVNQEESRPEISGVYVEQGARGVVVVGTDSYRLAERSLGAKQQFEQKLLVPLRAMQEVARVAGASTEVADAEVVANASQALWRFGETRVISRLIAGQYPDYQQLIPKEFATSVVLLREELLRAVRAASLFVRSGVNDVRLTVDPGAKTMRVASTNSQLGENTTELALSQASGSANEVAFNYRYLVEGLQAMRSEEVSLDLVDDKRPGVFKPVGTPGYLYIVMPIRQ